MQNVHTGVIDAVAKPEGGFLQFADGGSVPFDKAKDNAKCLVRMQRVGALLSSKTTTAAAASW